MNKINRFHERTKWNGILIIFDRSFIKGDIDKFIGHPLNYGKQKIL